LSGGTVLLSLYSLHFFIDKHIEILRDNKYIETIYEDIKLPDERMKSAFEKIQEYLENQIIGI